MSDGIRIEDAAIDISPAGLEGLLGGGGPAEVSVSRVTLTVSEEVLNTVLRHGPPGAPKSSEGAPAAATGATGAVAGAAAGPSVQIQPDGVSVDLNRGGKQLRLALRFGKVQVEFGDGVVRVTAG